MSRVDRAVDVAEAVIVLPSVVAASAWYIMAGVPVWAWAETRRLLGT